MNLQTYVGTARPYNFNGLVRHYYLRRGPNVADIQVNLESKGDRELQSHEIAKQVRDAAAAHRRPFRRAHQGRRGPSRPAGARNLVAEVYGPNLERRIALAKQMRDIFKNTGGVVDVDWYVEDDQPKYRIRRRQREGRAQRRIGRRHRPHPAARLRRVSGRPAARRDAKRRTCLSPCASTAPRAPISSASPRLRVAAASGRTGRRSANSLTSRRRSNDQSIYHKNLMPVTYVTADVAGAMESPVYAILKLGPADRPHPNSGGLPDRAAHGRRALRCRAATP